MTCSRDMNTGDVRDEDDECGGLHSDGSRVVLGGDTVDAMDVESNKDDVDADVDGDDGVTLDMSGICAVDVGLSCDDVFGISCMEDDTLLLCVGRDGDDPEKYYISSLRAYKVCYIIIL